MVPKVQRSGPATLFRNPTSGLLVLSLGRVPFLKEGIKRHGQRLFCSTAGAVTTHFIATQFSEMAEDGGKTDSGIVEGTREAKEDDSRPPSEVRAIPHGDADGDEQAEQVEAERPHRQRVSAKVLEELAEAVFGEGGEDGDEENEEKLGVDVEVEFSVSEQLQETDP